jgi:glycosyltransferase involved in cell wall biosynthesis
MTMPSGGDNSLLTEDDATSPHPSAGKTSGVNGGGSHLNVLVLDEEIPFPLNSGKRIRTWNLLRNLSHEHTITFLCYGTTDHPGLPMLEKLGIRVVLVQGLPPYNSFAFYAGAFSNIFSPWPYSVSRHHTERFSRAIRDLVAKELFDLVHFEWTPYASYINDVGRLPTLIMAHNIEATVWRRRAQHASNPLEQLFMRMQEWKMVRFEKKCFSRSDCVVAVSEEEQRTAKQWGARAVYLVSNGVDIESLHPADEAPERDSLLFLGSLDWQPNRDALLYLLREILPKLQATNPQAKLRVVGRQPATRLREQVEGFPGVEWVGEVPEIRPYFARAAVVLVPLRIGGGSRIKILESRSMGQAVGAPGLGAAGLKVVSGVPCLVADSPEDFSRCIAQLLDDPQLAAEFGKKGRELVVQRYDWSCLAKILAQAWLETANPIHK